MYPNFDRIVSAYEKKGHTFYTNRTYNLNVGAIRSMNSKSNEFDDILFTAYYEDLRKPVIHCWPATTDPGKYWLQNPMNKNGTAIVVPGQYRNSHCLGLHGRSSSSPYAALEQCGDMLYVRDNNKDTKLDFDLYRDPVKLAAFGFRGNIKTNIHRASAWKIIRLIERYSAGCQVLQNPKDFDMLIRLYQVYLQKGFPNRVTYTLFEEIDVWN